MINCGKGKYTYFILLNVFTTIIPLLQFPLLMGLLNHVKVLEVITIQNAETPTYCFTHAQAVYNVIKNVFFVCY